MPSTVDEVLTIDAVELAERYRNKSLSPVEMLDAVQSRIEAVEPKLNAFLYLHHQEAREAARASEARWAKGEPQGALDGVPLGIKDHIMVDGWKRRNGSPTSDPDAVADYDSPAVARLREEGAVFLGKTTMTEFGWKGTSDSPLTGATRNPWDTSKTCGGSSSGSSAAVAAGICPVALGTDGGGSVRIPASLCGLVGLKASGGRIPYWPFSFNHTLTHLGPLTRSVRDAATMLNVLARPDPRDWYALPYLKRDYTVDLDVLPDGLRFVFSQSFCSAQPDAEVLSKVEEVVNGLERDGQPVTREDPPLGDTRSIFGALYAAGLASTAKTLTKEQFTNLEPALRQLIERGRQQNGQDYAFALQQRLLLGHRMKMYFGDNTLLVSPTTMIPAFDVNLLVPPGMSQDEAQEWHHYCYPFNLSLQPAISIPIGFTSAGLPIGLQIVGPLHREDLVLQVARRIESIQAAPAVIPAVD